MTRLPPTLLAGLVDQSREWLVVSDVRGQITWVNPAFEAATGWSGAVGAHLPSWLMPAEMGHAVELQDRLAEALCTGRLADTVVRLQPPSAPHKGDELWVSLRIGSVGEARLWTMGDVRAERAGEARTRRLEELLDTAQEFGRMGVWERDIGTGTGRWDAHVFRYWGLDPANGTPSFDDAMSRVHPEDRKATTFPDSTRRAGRYAQRYRVFGTDGGVRWIHSQWEVKAGPDGVPTRAVGVMVDDTEAIALAHSLDDASAQLALAVDLGQIVVWRHDLRSKRMHYSPRGFAVLAIPYRADGLSLEEVRSFLHPDDLPAVVAADRRAMLESGPTDMEARYRRADGVWRHVLTRRVLQRDADGKPLAFVGVALDLTDSVEQQRQAAELQRRLEYATMAAGIGVWSRDTVTQEAHWNDQMYRLCNHAPELGPPSWDEWLERLIHPDDRAAMRQALPELMGAASGAVEHEYRILKPEGGVRWLANRARLEDWNGHPMIFGVTLDVTERRLADQALRQANERVALATRGAGIATWEHELASDDVRWDAQMYALRGLTMPTDPVELRRAPHALRRSLAHPDELPLLLEIYQHSLARGTMASYEFRVRWPDGSYRWLASRSIPVYDEWGRPVRQIGVNWDIHERVTAEAIRREALAAQRQSEARSQFFARMSHELRTPLNAILGFTQLLESEAQSATGDRAMATRATAKSDRLFKLRHIRSASEQLLSLVNEVLDLSSIESGELQVRAEPVALNVLVHEVLAELGPAAQARGIMLAAAAADYTVLADAARLRQVLVKLLEHRIRRIARGSTVQVQAADDGEDAVLSIGDNDHALQQLSLFDTAVRTGLGDPTEGGGVDMAWAKALMACMNGRIEIDRSTEQGHRFLLWLPHPPPAEGVAPALRASACTAPREPAADGRPDTTLSALASARSPTRLGKVLYIEDNHVNVILVEELIAQRGGLELVCETTGEAGVARATVMQPDLVLIDMQLPDFDGFEVLRRLRADPATARASCIALSANAIPDDVARAMSAGFDDYWTKPIRFKSFMAGLDGLFPPGPTD